MKNIKLYILFFGIILTLLTGCNAEPDNRNELDDIFNQNENETEKKYKKIICEEEFYIDTKYYVYVKSGKHIASIEFDEENKEVHKYTLSTELTLENSATNDTLKKHAEEFNDYCKENNKGEFISCTYSNSVSNGRKTTVVGEYDLLQIKDLPTSVNDAKKFLESQHGMECIIK